MKMTSDGGKALQVRFLASADKLLPIVLGLIVAAAILLTRIPILLGSNYTARLSPDWATRLAQAALAGGEPGEAEALARAALRNRPLDAEALGLWALAQQQQQEFLNAGEALALAGALSWRETDVQISLLDAAVRSGEFESAVNHAEALARRGKVKRTVMSFFHMAAADPQLRPVMIERLKRHPPWRSSFFSLSDQLRPADLDRFTSFVENFVSQGGTLSAQELRPLMSGLVNAGRFVEARSLWSRTQNAPESVEGLVWDGGFRAAQARPAAEEPGPFEWSFPSRKELDTFIRVPPGGSDPALHVRWRNMVRSEAAAQTLVLYPGAYYLQVDARANQSDGLGAMRWQIECFPSGEQIGVGQPQFDPQGNWTTFTQSFSIPGGTRCAAQQLKLLVDSLDTGTHDLWIDQVRVVQR